MKKKNSSLFPKNGFHEKNKNGSIIGFNFKCKTASLPLEDDTNNKVTYYITNKAQIERYLEDSVEMIINSIEEYLERGSDYRLKSFVGAYLNIGKRNPQHLTKLV